MSVFDPFHHDHINTPRKHPPDNPILTSDGWGCRMKTGGYNPPLGGLDKSLERQVLQNMDRQYCSVFKYPSIYILFKYRERYLKTVFKYSVKMWVFKLNSI